MTRSSERVLISEMDVLVNLARAVPLGQEVVQIGASRLYPAAWHDPSPFEVDPERVGLLHLGLGQHQKFAEWEPLLVRGAIVLFEGYQADGPVYDFAIDLAARGYLSSLSEAKYWRGLGVCTYMGGGR